MDTGEKRIRTLVVDDSPVALRSICSFLEGLTLIKLVGTAANSREAIAVTHILRPDLVLLDVQMPVMSGLEAAPQLRLVHPGMQVVMITVHDTPGVRQACQECGFAGFIAKERGWFRLQLLGSQSATAAIRKFCNRAWGARSPRHTWSRESVCQRTPSCNRS